MGDPLSQDETNELTPSTGDINPETLDLADENDRATTEDAQSDSPVLEVASFDQSPSPILGAVSPSNESVVQSLQFGSLPGQGRSQDDPQPIDLLLDIQVQMIVELGRKDLTIKDALALGPGAVVELDRIAGDPVDLLVNNKLVARGEVVVIDENFGVRVTEVIRPTQGGAKVA